MTPKAHLKPGPGNGLGVHLRLAWRSRRGCQSSPHFGLAVRPQGSEALNGALCLLAPVLTLPCLRYLCSHGQHCPFIYLLPPWPHISPQLDQEGSSRGAFCGWSLAWHCSQLAPLTTLPSASPPAIWNQSGGPTARKA